MTEGVLPQVQASMIRSTNYKNNETVHSITLCNIVDSCGIHEALNFSLPFQIQRSQLQWFGHMTKIPEKD